MEGQYTVCSLVMNFIILIFRINRLKFWRRNDRSDSDFLGNVYLYCDLLVVRTAILIGINFLPSNRISLLWLRSLHLHTSSPPSPNLSAQSMFI